MRWKNILGTVVLVACTVLAFSCNTGTNTPTKYTVTFNANGGSGTMASQTIAVGTSVRLNANAFTRTGYNFDGWATSAAGSAIYADGGMFSVTSGDITLYAAWSISQYSISFNANGASGSMADQILSPEAMAAKSTALSANSFTPPSGCAFAGWTTNVTGVGTVFADQGIFDIAMDSTSLTLYAVWLPTALSFQSAYHQIVIKACDTDFSGDLSIPCGVTSIDQDAFLECAKLEKVELPPSLLRIEFNAFRDCFALESINIPSSVTFIGNFAFGCCWALTSIAIPSSVTEIPSDLFNYCRGLTSVTISEGVTSIGYRAFEDCWALPSVTIPEGVTSIDHLAFYHCNALTSVTLPASLSSIGGLVFGYSTKLATVFVKATTPPTFKQYYTTDPLSYLFEGCSPSLKIYVPAESYDSYVTSWAEWKDYLVGYDYSKSTQAISCTITIPGSGSASVSGATSVSKGSSYIVSIAGSYASYAWDLDGDTIIDAAASSATIDTSSMAVGSSHGVTVFVTDSSGDEYSARLNFTVTN